MKKFLAVTALLSLSATSMAATSGTLLLQGVVPKKISIDVSPASVASALVLDAPADNLIVATVNEKSNSKAVYSVTITSPNLGKLKRTDGADVFPYTLKYGGSSVGLSTLAGTTFSNGAGAAVNVNKDLTISYAGTPAESMVEGTYADTLTLEIASN